jgi:hypothetical protein
MGRNAKISSPPLTPALRHNAEQKNGALRRQYQEVCCVPLDPLVVMQFFSKEFPVFFGKLPEAGRLPISRCSGPWFLQLANVIRKPASYGHTGGHQ